MRKVLMALLASVMVMACGICSAQITEADLNIGGIYYGMPAEDIYNAFGNPVEKRTIGPHQHRLVFKSPDKQSEILVSFRDMKVNAITISSPAFMRLNSGINAESSLEDVINIYGEPVQTSAFSNSPNNKLYAYNYFTEKEHINDPSFPYISSKMLSFVFNDGRLKEIDIMEKVEMKNESVMP